MTIYVHVANGRLAGFYASDIHKPPLEKDASAKAAVAWHADPRPAMPEGVIAITDEDHQRWAADQTLTWDGSGMARAP